MWAPQVSTGGMADDIETMTNAAVDASQTATGTATQGASDRRDEATALARGSAVGRYLILGKLGKGGMGVVYSAYDPDLDRKIAVKLMRSGRLDPQGRARILREAQAMAKLSHPNVVSVYDVGTFEEQVFIAMELIDGVTLRTWMRQPRPWQEVVQLMVQAGRGLAAAHGAGLIHRDVKPANILIDADGRVRVMDFGVARPMDGADSLHTPLSGEEWETDESADDYALNSEDRARLTRAGAAVGTPAYMAPEQFDGITTPATDQYSFCVTLYEALYGERPDPYDGKKSTSLTRTRQNAELSQPRTGPRSLIRGGPKHRRGSDTPGWVRNILRRGLHRDPDKRYPSMDQLLAELGRDPHARRRRAAVVAAVVASAAGSLTLAATWASGDRALCAGAQGQMETVWNSSARSAFESAFAATGRPYAADTAQRVGNQLSRRASEWIEMRTEACRATRVRGEQSERMLDLRMSCLDRRLGEMRALTELFIEKADADVVDKAIQATLGLPRIATCADAESLTAAYPMPTDPDERARIEAQRADLARATALAKAGKIADARTALTNAVEAVEALEYPPLNAEALTELANLHANTGDADRAEALLYDAVAAAAQAGDRDLGDFASSRLIYVIGYRQTRYQEALAVGKLLDSRVGHAPGRDKQRSQILHYMGLTQWTQGNYAAAQDLFERGLALLEQTKNPEPLDLANALNSMGLVLKDQGKFDQAQVFLERALALWEQTLGPHHVDVARPLNNLAEVFTGQKQYERARELYERSLAIFEGALGKEHVLVALVVNNLGELSNLEGRFPEAQSSCERALAIAAATLPANHPFVGYHLTCLGRALNGLGRHEAAIEPLERALALRTETPGDPNDLADTRFALARALWGAHRAGQRDRALELARSAHETYSSAGPHKREQRDAAAQWLRAPE